MASSAHVRAVTDFYPIQPNTEALKQSMIAEFALAHDDIPTAIHNYTVLAIKSNSLNNGLWILHSNIMT